MQGFWSGLVQRVGHGANASNLAFFVLLVTVLAAPRLARLAHLPSLVALVLLGMAVGPHGFGLLATQQIALAALGEFGLLYLMFTAGLELDLKRFVQNKKAALGFAALSFSIPLALGIVSARLLGYAWAAAVLMGSNWSSHTLVTYPALRDMGLAHSRPVSIVVSATMLTDTSALLVLAAVSVSTRRNGSFFAEGAEVMIGLALLVVWSLMALPRIARWFFARSGADVTQRVLFSLVALCVGAVLAESAGIDGIVGAFFAGLGLGSTIPEKSPLMDRVRFLGASLLVPFFLVSVGVLLDPLAMVKPKTLLYALVFSLVVLGGKSLAAVFVGRAARFSVPEVAVMSGLSGSQAAATLATTLVGARLGLFDSLTVHAVLVVILVTLVATSALVNASGTRVATALGAPQP